MHTRGISMETTTFCIFLECSHGMYGHNCLGSCRIACKVPERCDKVTGHCNGGCQAGWTGLWCEEGKILVLCPTTKY